MACHSSDSSIASWLEHTIAEIQPRCCLCLLLPLICQLQCIWPIDQTSIPFLSDLFAQILMNVQPIMPALEDAVSTLRAPSPACHVVLAILHQGMEEHVKVHSMARCHEQGNCSMERE